MISQEQIEQVIKSGIARFEKPYSTVSENIQIVFIIGDSGSVQYITCVNQAPVNTVTLKQLIGSNFYNSALDTRIKKMLQRLAAENMKRINVIAGVKEGKVYLSLREHDSIIREITPGELVN